MMCVCTGYFVRFHAVGLFENCWEWNCEWGMASVQRRDESPGHGSPGQRFWPGRLGSRVNMSDPVFDQVLRFNMSIYRGIVSSE